MLPPLTRRTTVGRRPTSTRVVARFTSTARPTASNSQSRCRSSASLLGLPHEERIKTVEWYARGVPPAHRLSSISTGGPFRFCAAVPHEKRRRGRGVTGQERQ